MKKAVIIIDFLWLAAMFLFFTGKLEVSGILGYFLWLIPLALSIAAIIKDKVSKRIVVPIIGAVFAVTALSYPYHSGRTLLKERSEGNNYEAVYELNPGAMGHTSYQTQRCRNIFESELLTIRWCYENKNTK